MIVSDNGSTRRSLSVVKRYGGRLLGLRIVDASDHRGRSHAVTSECDVQLERQSSSVIRMTSWEQDGSMRDECLSEDDLVSGSIELRD